MKWETIKALLCSDVYYSNSIATFENERLQTLESQAEVRKAVDLTLPKIKQSPPEERF